MGIRRSFLALLLLALLSTQAYSQSCPSSVKKIYLGAVTGENEGGVFQLEVETRPGNGSIYTSIAPRVGFSTQESEEMAVNYAFESTGFERETCDVLFRINGQFGENVVDGPSAGGAMAVATRAALLRKDIRQDIVMTGTISPDGKVGEVGGIIEKSIAAELAGASYIVVPSLAVHEALLISSVAAKEDFRALEVTDAKGAENIMTSDYSEEFYSEFRPKSSPLPKGLPDIELDAQTGRFALVSSFVVQDLEAKVKATYERASTDEQLALRTYFEDEIGKYNELIGKGYVFTAANSAFLLSIDAEYAKIGDAKVDLDGSIEDVSSCIGRLEPPGKTSENFHWAIGSDLRRIWAKAKLNDTLSSREGQGGYTTLRDLLFAYSWCGISGDLASQANDIGGKAADESKLSELSQKKISEAEQEIVGSARPDYDAVWHLRNAYSANESGQFGAAIYEATYAKVMQRVQNEELQNVSEAAKALLGERKSLWGKIYQGQGTYLYYEAVSEGFPPNSAYGVLKYAREIDSVAEEIDAELSRETPAVAPPEQPPRNAQDPLVSMILGISVGFAGLAVAYRLLMRGRWLRQKNE